jgi:hypothetical protein
MLGPLLCLIAIECRSRSQSAFDGPQPLRAVTHTPDPINLQAAYVLGAHSIHSLDYQPAFTML